MLIASHVSLADEHFKAVDLKMLKYMLRLGENDDSEDNYLLHLTNAAIDTAQQYIGKFIRPCYIQDKLYLQEAKKIKLHQQPLYQLDKLEYSPTGKRFSQFPANKYELVKHKEILLTKPLTGYVWVSYRVGYVDNSYLPASLMQAIMQHVIKLYEYPELNEMERDIAALYAPHRQVKL